MNDEEFAAFDGTWADFARVWTLKEAYCKYLGRSIWPPRAVPVPPPVPYRTYEGDGWRAALCGTEALPPAIRMVSSALKRAGPVLLTGRRVLPQFFSQA